MPTSAAGRDPQAKAESPARLPVQPGVCAAAGQSEPDPFGPPGQDHLAPGTTGKTIRRVFLAYAQSEGRENGRTVRIDSTLVETDVHAPTDSSLLQDGVRILTRWLKEAKNSPPGPTTGPGPSTGRQKARVLTIQNARKAEVRVRAFRDLLRYADWVRGYIVDATQTLSTWEGDPAPSLRAWGLAERLERALGILDRVIDQTERRVLHRESVPTSEKVVMATKSTCRAAVQPGPRCARATGQTPPTPLSLRRQLL